MKNVSLILNAVLVVAVIILFYLHFSSQGAQVSEGTATEGKKDTTAAASVKLPDIRTVNGPIAYINYDVLVEKYTYYKQLESQFTSFMEKKKADLLKKEQGLMEAIERYKQLAPSMSEQARAEREQQLAEEQNNLLMGREQASQEIAEKRENLNKDFLKKIDDYLRALSKEKNYSYVFTYSKGGPATIVFANDSLEITNQVIEGLNKSGKK